MRIDNLPISPLVNKDGNISDAWKNSLQQLVTQLQSFLGQEKYQLPLQPPLRNVSQGTSGLDIQSNFGSIYHNSVTNSPCSNIQVYADGQSSPSYQFTPITTYQNVATLDDLNAIPTTKINAKHVTVTAEPNKLYVGVGSSWQVITTANL